MIFNLNYTFALSPTAPGSGFSLALTEGIDNKYPNGKVIFYNNYNQRISPTNPVQTIPKSHSHFTIIRIK